MAKGRGGRGPSRLDKRREAEAAEAREREEQEKEQSDEEPEPESDDTDEEVEEIEAEFESLAEDDDDYDDEDGKKAKKKKSKKAAAGEKSASKRARVPKEVRRQAVWVVFDNASKVVEEFPYNRKEEAEALLARKMQEKEGKATYYLNLVKKEMKD